jgi:hypothetical protein
LNLFGDLHSYIEFASRRDFSFGLADVRDGNFVRMLESVLKALGELVSSGSVKAARDVILPSVPLAFLKRTTLIEGEWVDQHVFELAEFGAMLTDHGFTVTEEGDRHRLAWPLISPPKASAIGADTIREQVAEHMSAFGGHTILIDGRPYLNVLDYAKWSDRKLKGDLCYEDVFLDRFIQAMG